jgi:hypothetical protein
MRDADEKRKMRRRKEKKKKKKKKSVSSSTRPHGLISRPAASYLNQSWELSLMELSDSLLPAAVTVTVKIDAKCGARRSLGQGQISGRQLQLLLQLEPIHDYLHLLVTFFAHNLWRDGCKILPSGDGLHIDCILR